ncbi:helix-turn-helix domain-containing protein [Nocardia sp. IFM 10818]
MDGALIRNDKAILSITSGEVEQARTFSARLGKVLSGSWDAGVVVGLRTGDTVEMPAELSALVNQVLELVGRGCTVTVASIPSELTTTTAAKILGVSRPTLMKLIGEGELPSHKVRSHTRLLSKDVLAYRDRLRDRQRQAFGQLRDLEDELGISD